MAERLRAAREHASELEGLDAAERVQLQDAIDVSRKTDLAQNLAQLASRG
jgi:hypothetical protein